MPIQNTLFIVDVIAGVADIDGLSGCLSLWTVEHGYLPIQHQGAGTTAARVVDACF